MRGLRQAPLGGDDNKTERFVAVLEIPPVNSPEMAVKISIVNDIKAGKHGLFLPRKPTD